MRNPFKLYRNGERPFDVENELTALFSEQISREINRQIIRNLISLDLVEPLSEPSGHLLYLDFLYTPPIEHIELCITFPINYREPFKLKRENE